MPARSWQLNQKEIKRKYGPNKPEIAAKASELCNGDTEIMSSLKTINDYVKYIFNHESNLKEGMWSLNNDPKPYAFTIP